MTPRIYLDYNATAPLRPEAAMAMQVTLGEPLNASAVHSFGQRGRKIVETARAQVAALVGAPPAQVIFNSGATEGNNTVLKYFARENARILVSAIEHPSVLEAAPQAEKIPVTKDGVIDPNALEKILTQSPAPALLSLMLVNNETGAIQPVAKAAALAKKHGALVHCDAVQAAGRIPVDIAALGVDFLTLSAHKLGGPQGVGALILGLCGITPTLLDGGGQEKMARAGTENVAGIAGFGAAAESALQNLSTYQKRCNDFQKAIEEKILAITPNAVIHAAAAPRVPNTTFFSLPGASAQTLLLAFDLEGIALSNGSACSSGTVKASHVLKAMGVADDVNAGSLRISTGWETTEADVAAFLNVYEKIVRKSERSY